jgi:hypothetical protein
MKKTLIILFTVLLISDCSFAQESRTDLVNNQQFGFKEGINQSTVFNSQLEAFSSDSKFGLVSGVFAFFPVSFNPAIYSKSDSTPFCKLTGREDFFVRLENTSKTDLSEFTKANNQNPRQVEGFQNGQDNNGMNKGMYISVGCTFLLMILVIVLV